MHAAHVTPTKLRGKLRFAALTAELTRGGVDARRDDGTSVLVVWREVVGAVARRLPAELEGVTFVDLVSRSGSTLRVLPWTRLSGDTLDGDDRALALLHYIVGRCPDITLDPATRAFIEGRSEAAQLPN